VNWAVVIALIVGAAVCFLVGYAVAYGVGYEHGRNRGMRDASRRYRVNRMTIEDDTRRPMYRWSVQDGSMHRHPSTMQSSDSEQ
jgi:hypothetical protein